jgi:hypothetical protein
MLRKIEDRARVIYFKERNIHMIKKEIIRRGPFNLMGYETEDILPKGGFGALMARAGVGKTAFMVQVALDQLLRDKNVLHISLSEPVEKVCLWYEEVFRNIVQGCGIKKLDPFWEKILPNRFIMTFKAEGFSVPKLQERISDLTEQGIFYPQIVFIDGLPFEEIPRDLLAELKEIGKVQGMSIWFTVRSHRHEETSPEGMPVSFLDVADLFDVVIELRPQGKEVCVKALKGGPSKEEGPLILDPSTMMIRDMLEAKTA